MLAPLLLVGIIASHLFIDRKAKITPKERGRKKKTPRNRSRDNVYQPS